MQVNETEAAALLAWYQAMGADEAITEEPETWFHDDRARPASSISPAAHEPATTQPPLPSPHRKAPLPHTPAASFQTAPQQQQQSHHHSPELLPSDSEMQARELARSAKTLSDIYSLLEKFDGCPLKQTATKLVMARGAETARVMFIGEAPGKDEDAKGVPFVGRAGQLLDRMLDAIELAPEDVYITNIVYWRPPGNRTPTPQEAQVCQPFLERQIEIIQPQILVYLGAAAAKQLSGAPEGIMKLRGKWLRYESKFNPNPAQPLRAIATLHPAYLLRNPIAKRLAWRDLLLIKEGLEKDGKG